MKWLFIQRFLLIAIGFLSLVGSGCSYAAVEEFIFSNKCNHPVRLAVNYLDTDNKWKTVGWWNIAAGVEKTYLSHNNVRIQSDSNTWLYYAETTDGSNIVWQAFEKKVFFDGRLLKMRVERDRVANNSWFITCN